MMKKKSDTINVLLLMDQLYCAIAGTEQHVSFLLHNLPGIDCKVRLALLRDSGYYDFKYYPTPPHIIDFQTFKSPFLFRKAILRLKDIIQKYKIDIIYTFFPDSEIIAGLAVRKSERCVHIAARRNFGHGHNFVSLWRTRVTNKFIPNFIANCDAVKKRMNDLECIPLHKIHVIPNPINRNRMVRGLSETFLKKELGIDDKTLVVGIVATVSVVKDHESFLYSAQIVLNKFPEVKFIIAGRCQENRQNELNTLVHKVGIMESILFVGDVENPIPLMKLFDVGVLSSKSEGFSNTLLEYAAVGVPIVATDVGGNSEIVDHGVNGYLVPPASPENLASSIIKLLKNRELRHNFALAGQKKVHENYQQENILQRYREYFDNLIQKVD